MVEILCIKNYVVMQIKYIKMMRRGCKTCRNYNNGSGHNSRRNGRSEKFCYLVRGHSTTLVFSNTRELEIIYST